MQFILSNYVKPQLIKVNGGLCNASFFNMNGTKYLLGRITNYSFLNHNGNVAGWPFTSNYYTTEMLYKMNGDTPEVFKVLTATPEEIKKTCKYGGDEDFRIMCWNGEFHVNFTRTNAVLQDIVRGVNEGPMLTGMLSLDLDLINVKQIKTSQKVEKNWQPIEGIPHKFVYSYKPFAIIDTEANSITEHSNNFDINYRGSSCVIKYKDGYLTLVHYKDQATSNYYHKFVMFDKNLKLIKMSAPFKFFGVNIEFSAHAVVNNGKVEILASVFDQLLYKFEFSEKLLNDIFDAKLDNSVVSSTLYEDFNNDAIINNNALAVVATGTFCKNKDNIAQSLKFTQKLNINPNDVFHAQNLLISAL